MKLRTWHLLPQYKKDYNTDNQGTIALAKNPVNHKRAKHIENRIVLEYCSTADIVADVMTTPATKFKLEKNWSLIFGD